MKKEKTRQQGCILILNHMFYKYIKEHNNKGIHKNEESIVSMLLILRDVKGILQAQKGTGLH